MRICLETVHVHDVHAPDVGDPVAEAGGLGLVPGPVGEGDVRLEEGGLGGVQEDVGAGEVGWNGCDRYSGSVQKYYTEVAME